MSTRGHHGIILGGESEWTPGALAGLVVWSKADAPGNTLSSGTATNLANLAGVGTGASSAVSGGSAGRVDVTTLNSRPVLTADGTNRGAYEYNGTTTQFKDVPGIYFCAVARMRAADVTPITRSLLNVPRNSNGVRAELAQSRDIENAFRLGGRRLDGDTFASCSDAVNNGTSWCIVVGLMEMVNTDLFLRKNGALAASNTSFQTAGNTSNTNGIAGVQIGKLNNNTNYSDNYEMAEWMVGSALMPSGDQEKVEGYLAHQWGLTGLLPPGHPYKSVAP